MTTKAEEKGTSVNEASLALRNARLAELKSKSVPAEQRTATFVKQYMEDKH